MTFYNPLARSHWRRNLQRNHRKLLIIDGERAFTGGAGITDLFSATLRPADYWHELMLEIRGPLVADWQTSVQGNLAGSGRPAPRPAAGSPAAGRRRCQRARCGPRPQRSRGRYRPLPAQARPPGQVPGLDGHRLFPPLLEAAPALMRKARAGIDVRLLLPGPHTDHPSVRRLGQRHYGSLLRSGVRIFEDQPRFLHAKVQLCDSWASIGSSNLDRWNLRWNLEANQELDDPDILQQLERLFRSDFSPFAGDRLPAVAAASLASPPTGTALGGRPSPGPPVERTSPARAPGLTGGGIVREERLTGE